MKSALYLCLLLLGLQVQGQQQVQQVPGPEEQSQADHENLPHVKLAPSNADFAFKLYKQIRDESGNRNIFFSPLSISTAFAMLTLGARSNTLRELQKGLGFNLTQMEEQEIHEGFQRILQLLNDPHREDQLNMGNALFIDNKVELLQNFLDRVTNFYYAEPVSSNFQNLPQAIKEINTYVETKTHGKIVDLLKDLDSETVMILINYIFFRGSWERPFNSLITKDDDFFLDAKNSVKVKMMHQNDDFKVHRDEKLSCWVVEMPYKGNVTALFVLPDKDTMKQVEDALLKETVSNWLRALEEREIYLDLPKFSISGSYDVKSLFKKMGVTEVFSDQADLSGVAKDLLLKVSKAIHKATVDVRENGTEAAAVTMLGFKFLSAQLPPPPHITFNSPFLMMIIDKTTDGLLFLGKIVNPTAKEDYWFNSKHSWWPGRRVRAHVHLFPGKRSLGGFYYKNMKTTFYLSLLLAGFHTVAHSQLPPSDHNGHDPNDPKHHIHHGGEAMACLRLVPNNADFAFQFFREVAQEAPNKNIFFSPVSISTAFAMLALGARSATKSQILEGLAFNLTEIQEKEIHEGFHNLIHMLNHPEGGVQLNMGNAIFVTEKLKLVKTFSDDAKALYQLDAFTTDFNKPAEAEKQINDYIEKKTHGKITNLVKDMDPQTVMLLASFVFFKGSWEKPFKAEHTEEREFFVDAETTVKVPMMYQMGRFDFYFDEELSCTVVRLHYNGSATAFLVLPAKGEMKSLEQTLDKETIQKWSDHLFQRSMNLYFPKFSISGSYEISNTLRKMGIVDVFTNQADLSGITGTPDLKVSKVVHKASLDVDEKGTEAAAATAVEIMPMSLPPTIEFSHPFLMLIFDRDTNSTLFIGKIVNPTS
ncbi:uncharacterized protein RBU47_004328 [Passerculus sandwichensis]